MRTVILRISIKGKGTLAADLHFCVTSIGMGVTWTGGWSMKLGSILPLIRRFAPAGEFSSSLNLLMKRHLKTPTVGLRFRSSEVTGHQRYFVFRTSACLSPSAPNNKQRCGTDSTLSAKPSRPVICSAKETQHVSGKGVSLDA